jgi:hypothetical protein
LSPGFEGCQITAALARRLRVIAIGAGVTITPNNSHVLDHLLGVVLMETNSGTRLQAEYGAAYWQAHRADLDGALADGVQAIIAATPPRRTRTLRALACMLTIR